MGSIFSPTGMEKRASALLLIPQHSLKVIIGGTKSKEDYPAGSKCTEKIEGTGRCLKGGRSRRDTGTVVERGKGGQRSGEENAVLASQAPNVIRKANELVIPIL